MIITKKQINKLFIDYTKQVYKDCGRSLSKYDEARIKNKVSNFIKEYTLLKAIKNKLCKKSK